jgi:hypothetical protein
MNPADLVEAANTPRKVLARKNDGELIWIELNQAVTGEEMKRLEAENDFRFFENCNPVEQQEMMQFMIEENLAGNNPNEPS